MKWGEGKFPKACRCGRYRHWTLAPIWCPECGTHTHEVWELRPPPSSPFTFKIPYEIEEVPSHFYVTNGTAVYITKSWRLKRVYDTLNSHEGALAHQAH